MSTNKSPIPETFEPTILTESDVSSTYSLLNGALGPEAESPQSFASRHDVAATGDGEVVNDFAAFGPSPAPEKTQPPLWSTLTTYKYDIVLLSLLLQLLYSLSSADLENTYFFLPLVIYTVTKLIWLPKQNNSSILNALLLLNGMNLNRLNTLLQVLQVTGTLSQDVSIFLFTTIFTQSLYTTLRDSFVT